MYDAARRGRAGSGRPRHALAAAKAGVDAVFELPRAERLAAEQRRYVEVFSAGQGGDAGTDPHGG
ncbi:hypothetical protein N602_03700 [Mycobacterium avium subsp. hominissuis 10-5606]|nr:hypothetical protein N602_03700 [Mycobacterium avium subsp. hominissuis 10-5606]